MKSLSFSILFFAILSTQAFAIDIKDVEMFGYVRAGVGTNTYGGDQECFYNQGAKAGNEFRLGNECSNYLELGFKFNHIKSETKNVFTQFRIANTHKGNETFESSNQSTNFVEAFAEIQGMNDLPYSFWVGKRFYRDQDVYIDDYYYFGDMNGNGAGVGNIDVLGGKFSLAYLKRVVDTKTDKGSEGVTIYDARLKGVELTKGLKQHFWTAYGHAPEGTDTTTQAKYIKTHGFVVGTLLDYDLHGEGFNHFAALYGQGLMNDFNLYGNTTISAGDAQVAKKRLRFINHTTYNVSDRWAFHLSLNHDRLVNDGAKEKWYGIGARPIYRVTPTFHLVAEVGSSIVEDSGPTRKLMRLTFAPQLSISENIWGRPVLRAFYTHSFWNSANKTNVANNAPTYANKTSGGSYGFQMETFF